MWKLYLTVALALRNPEVLSTPFDDPDLKIVGGFPAEANATLHQVSIRFVTVDQYLFGRGHFCGGSLINNRTVLTAAHCLVNLETGIKHPAARYRVVGGSTQLTEITANTVVVRVAETIVHERFNPRTIANDVALLILASPIPEEHPTLKAIDLVSSLPAAGTACQTSGWGTVISGQQVVPVGLRAVNVTIRSTEECNRRESYNGAVKPGMFCAGSAQPGEDSCQGDSGGPLVCDGLLAGIVSHGRGCGYAGFPGIYTDVAYYQDWIQRCLAGGCSAGTSLVVSGGVTAIAVLAVTFYGRFL